MTELVKVVKRRILDADGKPIEKQIPEGKVEIDGKLVDRADVGFHLIKYDKDPRYFGGVDGTVYRRRKGAMVRISPRRHEQKKLDKERKRAEQHASQ